ncbi:MAG: type II toxin-antitoxin system RelE/ParE family toxin [Terriglobia bacterium]|jgi:mRNA interferase RelE/StbE
MYQLELLPPAIDDLRRLDKTLSQRIVNKLRWLAENFDSIRPQGLVGPLAGLSKLRVGDYRVIYEADRGKNLITIHLIGHRSEIYR